MKRLILVVCLLLSGVIFTSNNAFASPRDQHRDKSTVVVPVIQARFPGFQININSRQHRDFIWVPGHWERQGRFRRYVWIGGHWEKRARFYGQYNHRGDYRGR
ncbi:MAG: YXWGXW repeat-containing protein [Candidatus Omnitrophica bacterium]|nr:YXWGXW repeat-containing protein [Candidatus Omnitrophota bacterium]